MCIAIVKPMGVAIPEKSTLINCFRNNPDGAGFAFNLNGKVIIKKGFMTEGEFIKNFYDNDKKYDFKSKGVLIHTRIATHGGTNPQMCHPFPICDDEGALKKIEYISPYAVIHNGVISLTSAEATRKKSLSDTAVFVEKYLTKIAQNKRWFDTKANIELIEELIDSKMAILNGEGRIIMTNGFTEDNGIFYSNSSYKDNYSRYSKLSSYSWDYEEWEDDNWEYNPITKEYVYRSVGSKKNTTANTNTTNTTPKKSVPLMRLKKDETVIFTDGIEYSYLDTVEEYVDEEGTSGTIYDGFYLTKTGEIFSVYDYPNITENCYFINQKMTYEGDGVIIDDKTLKKVPFRADVYTYEHILEETGYEYNKEYDEVENIVID